MEDNSITCEKQMEDEKDLAADKDEKGGNGSMQDTLDILKLKTLLCFIYEDEKECTVSGIARILGKEKYAISRAMIHLEKDGLMDRSNIRHPKLTQEGRKKALEYEDKIKISINHLMYEGVDSATAREDAMIWALYNSERTMETIRNTEIRYSLKYNLRNRGHFDGRTLCRYLPDGIYEFPFVIYRGKEKNGDIISMANEGFAHPCVLSVTDHVGVVQLRAQNMTQRSPLTGKPMEGKVSSMKYFDNGSYISAMRSGEILSFPAAVLNFENIGSGIGQILHGTVSMKMTCSVGIMHMPESVAIFTMLI